jgi:hypothetical protein
MIGYPSFGEFGSKPHMRLAHRKAIPAPEAYSTCF